MPLSKRIAPLLLVGALLATVLSATERVHHRLTIDLDPETHRLEITDEIQVPARLADQDLEFLLNSKLQIADANVELEEVPVGETTGFYGINGSSVELRNQVELSRYNVVGFAADQPLSLTFAGAIDYGLSDPKEEYTRGFRETAGIVGPEGIYLGGTGFWYPYFDDQLIEFELAVTVPPGWHIISQGNGTSGDAEGKAFWDSAGAMDEIYLVGGPLQYYHETAGAVEAQVYLREEDAALAAKYLTTTAQYLEMYRDLIGTYPYKKFALVENFWETGYGMPSFTLLGPSIIRFPFILHSSYPHEILHNWWGNSVFVDYETGNWCEGLTAYMADHLVQEQRGKGEEYRRSTLQKYRNYVEDSRDFPLSEFRSRHSAATEAVGYGKTLMGFHMLRRQVGDDTFRQTLARFYRKYRGQRASFADLQKEFESASGEDLEWFFEPWVQRPGAASLAVTVDEVRQQQDSWVVRGSIDQQQDGEPIALEVPIVVQTESGSEVTRTRVDSRSQPFEIHTTERPLRLAVDPQFDLFRLLDPREMPPSIGQIFGQPEILALLPAAGGEAKVAAYRELVEGWQSENHAIDIQLDSELDSLPSDRAVWVLGAENRFARLFTEDSGVDLETTSDSISFEGEEVLLADHSLVVVRRHPSDLEHAVGWLVVAPDTAFPGIASKLPHYGKYSYLAFEGDEPTNVVKGQWPTSDSPLVIDLRPDGERHNRLAALPLEERTALAELPPVFSEKDLMAQVEFFASPDLEGRGIGSQGLETAATTIAAAFESYGLRPGGDADSFYQRFPVEGPDGDAVEVANIIGYLPGSKTEWADQSVIVSAHYDHLGTGWPDVRQGNEGKVHPGADDNASGVAVLLELAKSFAAGQPQRNLVFIAFTAEEGGRLGSKYYVEHPTPFPLEHLRGVVNIDTVGRLGDQKLSILGTGTSEEWPHIFRGIGFVTGIESRNVEEAAGGSDQMSFIELGIPGVQIFTQAHSDYHSPTDTADKIDAAGLVKVAIVVKEALSYLTEREEPLTVTIAESSAGAPDPSAAPTTGRRVRFGTVPEFAFAGPGVQVASVVPDSPAAKAGVAAGDVLTRMADREIADLQAYADLLKTLEPGQSISVTVVREGREIVLQATVEAR
ncbi:MAG: M20/M25/M40 family metallo-hydrolase [Acidobacteriota bacterium]